MALTNDDILKLVNFTIRKDTKGQPLTRENFSLLLESQGLEYYEELYDQYEKTQEITDSIKRFKVTKYGAQLSFTGNTIDIPADYAHSGSLYHKKSGTDVKPIDILDDDKFIMRQSEFIDAPSVDYPIARFTTDYIEYEPSALDQSYFGLSYLKYPTAAVYDYYIDSGGFARYLSVGATHTWLTGETDSCGIEQKNPYNDWFLPSSLELKAMYDNLHVFGVGDFQDDVYWSSSEATSTTAYVKIFSNGVSGSDSKSTSHYYRPCRSFTAPEGTYSLRDEGPTGGLIFYISGTTYYEAATSTNEGLGVWSDVASTLIGTTNTAIGTGQANTTAIINQAGNTSGAANNCDALSITITYTSKTKELDFNEEDKLKIAWRVLQAVGVPIDESGVYQYAEQLKLES